MLTQTAAGRAGWRSLCRLRELLHFALGGGTPSAQALAHCALTPIGARWDAADDPRLASRMGGASVSAKRQLRACSQKQARLR